MQAIQHEATPPARARRTPAHSITTLYRQFEAAHAAFRKALANLEAVGINKEGPENDALERVTSKCNRLSTRIVRMPATSMPEIMLKLRIVAWRESDLQCERPEDLDHWLANGKPSADAEESVHILAELQADLLRLAAH